MKLYYTVSKVNYESIYWWEQLIVRDESWLVLLYQETIKDTSFFSGNSVQVYKVYFIKYNWTVL